MDFVGIGNAISSNVVCTYSDFDAEVIELLTFYFVN